MEIKIILYNDEISDKKCIKIISIENRFEFISFLDAKNVKIAFEKIIEMIGYNCEIKIK